MCLAVSVSQSLCVVRRHDLDHQSTSSDDVITKHVVTADVCRPPTQSTTTTINCCCVFTCTSRQWLCDVKSFWRTPAWTGWPRAAIWQCREPAANFKHLARRWTRTISAGPQHEFCYLPDRRRKSATHHAVSTKSWPSERKRKRVDDVIRNNERPRCSWPWFQAFNADNNRRQTLFVFRGAAI